MKQMTVKIPCYNCSGKKVTYSDCGYSTFNPGTVKCCQCGFEVEVADCSSLNPWPALRKAWNRVNKNIEVTSFEELRKILVNKQPLKSCSMTLYLEDLKDILKQNDDINECHRVLDQIEKTKKSTSERTSTSLLERLKNLQR